jgi:hypothetical protein
MGAGLDTITGFVTAPGATFTPWTLAAGDSLTIRNANPAKRTMLMQFWGWNQAVGTLRIRSPKLHDNVQGLRASIIAADVEPLLPMGVNQILYPQDVLIAEQTGSGTGGQIETGSILVWYEDLPGVAGRFIDVPTLSKRLVNVVTVENSITPGSAGGYSGQAAINANFDLLQANTDYALMGYVVSARCASVCWRGPDTGNLRVGGIGEPSKRDVTADWFWNLSYINSMALMPVIASPNKNGTFVDIVSNQTGAAVTVTSIFGQLAPA